MNRLMCKKAGMKAIAATFVVFFALGQSGAYATDTHESTELQTKIISSVQHVEEHYNAFGVCYMSTETSDTVTQSSNGETTSTTRQHSFTMQTWKGGSIKPDYSESTSTSTGDDGSSSVTNSKVTYSYDANGRLASASGTAHTEGTLAKDANGQSGGTYVSDQTTSYIIKNAQALPSQTVTKTTQYLEGQVSQTSREVTNFSYELLGGAWRLMKEVSTSTSTSPDGSGRNSVTTKTYSRDSNGVCTGLSQTMTGTITAKSTTNGTETWKITNYKATPEFDEQQGWHFSDIEYDKVLQS